MRVTTERYNAARLAGAKPIILAYIGSDQAVRCVGKETPHPDHLDPSLNAFDWSARVLTFGDYIQRLSSSGEHALLSLTEEEIGQYTLTCDNVGFYFSIIAGNEEFLGGTLQLFQGWDYPGMTYADYLQLFSGIITDHRGTDKHYLFTAKQAVNAVVVDDPTVDITKIYGLENGGSGDTAAEETTTYSTVYESFFTEDSWTYTVEIERDTTGVSETIFAEINDTYGERLEIFIDSDDKVNVTITTDLVAGDTETVTSDFTVGTDKTRIQVTADATAGTITISDNKGNVYVYTFEDIAYSSKWGTNGSGNGEFDEPFGVALDAIYNVYVCDNKNTRVQKFDSSGTYVTQWGSAGTGNGQFNASVGPEAIAVYGDIVYVMDRGNRRVHRFYRDGSFLSEFGSSTTIDSNGGALAVSYDGYVYVVNQYSVSKFDSIGTLVRSFGSSGSGDGEFTLPWGVALDTLGNVYVSDRTLDRVQKFDSLGNFILEWGTTGSGDGQLDDPRDLSITGNYVYVVDSGNDRVQKFDTSGTFIDEFGSSGSGDGQFTLAWGIAVNVEETVYVSDNSLDRVQKFGLTNTFQTIDTSDVDPGSNEIVVIGDDFDGIVSESSWQSGDDMTWQVVNSASDSETEWEDLVGDLDITVVDADWAEVVELETYTETVTTETIIEATEEIVLPMAGIYSNAGPNQQNVILPHPYGNCNENSDAAVHVCPLINQTAYTYCVAAWPIQSVANGNTITVYVDGVATSSGWTFYDSYDYESQGNIAILTFGGIDPGGTVAIRCNGKWVDGELLTNPIDIIEDWMVYAAALLDGGGWQTNATNFAWARNFCHVNRYVAAGVIQANNSLGFWLKSILASFLGSFSMNTDGEIEISFLTTDTHSGIMEDLQEYEGIEIEAQKKLSNVVRQVCTNYAISNAEVDRRFKNNAMTSYFRTQEDTQDTTVSGAQILNLNFDWNRRTASVQMLNAMILAIYGSPQYTITYSGQDFKFLPLDLLDRIEATLSLVRDEDGSIPQNQPYELRQKQINLDNFTSNLIMQGVDEGAEIDKGWYVYLDDSPVYLGTKRVRLGAKLSKNIYLKNAKVYLGSAEVKLGSAFSPPRRVYLNGSQIYLGEKAIIFQ